MISGDFECPCCKSKQYKSLSIGGKLTIDVRFSHRCTECSNKYLVVFNVLDGNVDSCEFKDVPVSGSDV